MGTSPWVKSQVILATQTRKETKSECAALQQFLVICPWSKWMYPSARCLRPFACPADICVKDGSGYGSQPSVLLTLLAFRIKNGDLNFAWIPAFASSV